MNLVNQEFYAEPDGMTFDPRIEVSESLYLYKIVHPPNKNFKAFFEYSNILGETVKESFYFRDIYSGEAAETLLAHGYVLSPEAFTGNPKDRLQLALCQSMSEIHQKQSAGEIYPDYSEELDEVLKRVTPCSTETE